MNSNKSVLSLALLSALLPAGVAQAPSAHAPDPKVDYSQEAWVIEDTSTKVALSNDGNYTREQSSRIRVQTDAGVQNWGLLRFPFESATQTVEIDYVRVHKADGTTLITPPDNVQDLDAEITRAAPFYSDQREKHVAVKGLGKGDILEFEAHWRTSKPLIPGQFWFQYSFQHEGVVLRENLEIKVPAERQVKLKGPQSNQTVSTAAGSRVYTWTYSRLQSSKEPGSDEKKQIEAARGVLPPPDVQISSFQSWEEVGRWYWNLQKDRVEPSAAVRAKADELTKGMTDDAAKMRALYNFVSTRYRYIGIAFGIGRYQPHTADDVLTNNYGDCKDKQTLLASLFQASGLILYPALINSSRKLDPDVPSPAQFDHVIGYTPQTKEKDKDAIWLDTTPEVGPFGTLLPALRDKQALVMSDDKSVRMVTTPADSSVPNIEHFKIEGKLAADGTLDAKVEDTTQGDAEVMLRAAFRQVPQPQWQELVQRISYAIGYAGTVSEVTASTTEAISDPFRFSYSYHRKDYPDWKSDQRFTVPGMPFSLPAARDDATDPVWLGSPMEAISDTKVEPPHGYQSQTPPNVDLKYDFAEYHASYSQDHGVLVAKRRLLTKVREIPVSEFGDYRDFIKNMQNDINRYVPTSSNGAMLAPGTPNGRVPTTLSPALRAVRELPESSSLEANRLESKAWDEVADHDLQAALSSLHLAVSADPKFARAWVVMGSLLFELKQIDSGMDAFRQAMISDPKTPIISKAWGWGLMGNQQFERAVRVWQDYMTAHPGDIDGPSNLGNCLVRLKRYSEAAVAYQAAVKIAPENPRSNSQLGALLMRQKRYAEAIPYLETAAKSDDTPGPQYSLGSAYLRAGQVEKGVAVLQKVVGPDTWNDVAYELAEDNVDLPKALEYAHDAVHALEIESHDIELSNILPEDLERTVKIGMDWDTLGWVHFRLGQLDQAETYLHAAWLLSQDGVEADHLGQVYEQQKKTEKAIHMYRMALSMPETQAPNGSWEETRQRLERLTGEKAPTAMDLLRSDPNGGELSQLRTVKLKPLISGSATAEFFLLFSPGPRVDDVEFISGSEKLKSSIQALKTARFQVAFPEASSARLVRRAIVMCSSVSGCNAVLFTPDSVHSVK
jgi:tetratricopeptide (TPR) repeat protein